jgi:hypothetical protein
VHKITTLQVTVRYDDAETDEDAVCAELTILLNTALSTPGIAENISVSDFEISD